MSPSRDLPRGISRTPTGFRAQVMIDGRRLARRFTATASVPDMEAWIRTVRAKAELKQLPALPAGSFAADARAYLALRATMPTYTERKAHIGEWVALFGSLPRASITSRMVEQQKVRWLTVGPKRVQEWKRDPVTGKRVRHYKAVKLPLSASAVNHRLRALENLWTVLDGRHAPNPVRAVREVPEPESPPRALPLALIDRVLSTMRDSVAKAWCLVIAGTGLPHQTIARMRRAFLDLDAPSMWVPGRLKGRGTDGRRVGLTARGVAAWRLFISLDAFRTTPPKANMKRAWRTACDRVIAAGVEPEIATALRASRVYDLRHSVGTAVAGAASVESAQMLLGVTRATALRYVRGAIDARLVAAVASLEAAQDGAKVGGIAPASEPPAPESAKTP